MPKIKDLYMQRDKPAFCSKRCQDGRHAECTKVNCTCQCHKTEK